MKKAFRRGLVVGKFSPLHGGHELVIRTAISQCEQTFVLSYSEPELAGCDSERRASWLRSLFPEVSSLVLTNALLAETSHPELPPRLPHNDASELAHRQFVAATCRVFFNTHVDAVFTSEEYGPGFARELTAYFARFDPNARPVVHVSVDRERIQVPISGTAIRANVEANRGFLAPLVRASLVPRILLLGGESTGKSTLASALATHCQSVFVAEYGRELYEERAGALSYEDLLHIGREQVRREEAAAELANRYLFCDTSPLTTLFYCLSMFARAEPELFTLADRKYALTVLCAPDIPFVQDGTRRDSAFRDEQHAWYVRELEQRGIHWALAEGSLFVRIERVVAELRALGNG